MSVLVCLFSPSCFVMEQMKSVKFSAFERYLCKGNSLINKPGHAGGKQAGSTDISLGSG